MKPYISTEKYFILNGIKYKGSEYDARQEYDNYVVPLHMNGKEADSFEKWCNDNIELFEESKQYLEPVGFRGTPGKWFIENNFVKGGQMYKPLFHFVKEDAEDFNDAKLISQSKELAKALQDMVEYHELEGEYNFTRRVHELKRRLANAKQVLKDAGLTDK